MSASRTSTEASRATHIVCVQNAYNLADRTSEPVLNRCEELGIAFVPFFPLGSAFAQENPVPGIPGAPNPADRRGASPAEIALAWLLARSPAIALIPGTSSVRHFEENYVYRRPGARRRGHVRYPLAPSSDRTDIGTVAGDGRASDRRAPASPHNVTPGPFPFQDDQGARGLPPRGRRRPLSHPVRPATWPRSLGRYVAARSASTAAWSALSGSVASMFEMPSVRNSADRAFPRADASEAFSLIADI